MHPIAQSFMLRLFLCFILVTALLLPNVSLVRSDAAQGTTPAHRGRPKWTRPDGTFPDLEDIKRESNLRREPAAPVPSNRRSRKNEGKPWDGRRVGESFTPARLDQVAVNRRRQLRRAHAHSVPQPSFYESQFIDNFFSVALQRSATSEESLYWIYLLRAGHGQSATSLRLAATEFGRTLFESASYLERNRNAHDYVQDLYRTYLMREPDAGGWATWEGLVATHGREYVRRGFEESGEFAALMGSLVPSGAPGSAASLISARVDPANQPGNGMLTRDAGWSVPLLSLPGRNGLNLGLTLSYSSMVWTRSGPYFYFDEDHGFPSPGFRLGFPTVQRKAFDAQTGKNSYLMLTPSGHRVDLRQVGASAVYEAADSSYLQLTENVGHLLVRATDGTQLTFVETNGEYRCTQLKDRNGNYLTVNYNSLGQLATITDTLGRVITFNYDTNDNLLSITQAWGGQTQHQWVGFGWSASNMQHSFSSDRLVGTRNGETVPVITQVTLNDTSHFTFEYNNSLQVSAIRNYFGTLERNATTFVYQTASGDVPRLSSSSVSARNWSGYNNVPAQVTTQYSVDVDGACVLTAPDGVVYKTYYGTGWQKGLVTASRVEVGGVAQKWTITKWTQDNEAVSYPLNPRVIETNIHDNGNRRRTTIHYSNSAYAQFGLPAEVREYAADAETVIRQTITDYDLSQAYLDRRLIGLVSQVQVTNGSQAVSKLTYAYDDPARLQALPVSATQHDTAYSTSLTARGNVTSVSRWDVNDLNNQAKKLTSFTNYFVTGSPASATDPVGHINSISYADVFSDNVSRNTFAYPTMLTDADNNSSYLRYHFDLGATTRTESPAPAGQSQGTIKTMTYNNLGQLERVTTVNNNAYQRFWYGAEFTASYASVNNVADELYSVQVMDGHGRVIGALRNHPGSALGYSLVHSVYDLMGRTWLQSNPAEVNNSWSTTGGDDSAGLYYTQQTYDWKDRPLVTTNQDGTTKTVSYSGCGCAGGEVITFTDEGTLVGGVTKKRQRRIYSDTLGRVVKSEILNWDGTGPNGTGGTVYATSTTSLNARDQVTEIRQYSRSEGSPTFQDITMSYDGYGRLKTRHVPEQDAGKVTTWNYNSDDTIQSRTDGRGALTSYAYNNRHLPEQISHSLSGSSEIVKTLEYDAVGNRTSISHTIGGVAQDDTSYSYNALSQLTSETKHINAVAGNVMQGDYTISYTYSLSGQLKSITDPFGASANYSYDTVGRRNNSTVNYGGVSHNYVTGVVYRAWNAVKSISYGGTATPPILYNARMMPTQFRGSPGRFDYSFYDDGRLKSIVDLDDQGGSPSQVQFHYMSRQYYYDQAERISGVNGVENYNIMPPFDGLYGYDAFGNLISRSGGYALNETQYDTSVYTNNRRNGWTYDEDGRVKISPDPTTNTTRTWTYDAVGNRTLVTETTGGTTSTNTLSYDGDDELMKDVVVNNGFTTSNYMIKSAVLDKVFVKLDASGSKHTTYVPVSQFATVLLQVDFQGNPITNSVNRDALGLQENNRAADPFGNLIANVQPPIIGPPPNMPFYGPGYLNPASSSFNNANSFAVACMLDGITTPCEYVMRAVNSGSATQCPGNYCGPRHFTIDGQPGGWAIQNGGNGFWLSDGSSAENVFFDDLMYGSLLEGLTAHFIQSKDTKKKRSARVPRNQSAPLIFNDPYDPPFNDNKPRADCIVFAGVVDVFAAEENNDRDFIRRVYHNYKQANNAYDGSGFKERFIDPTSESPNQVRHAAGAIAFGYGFHSLMQIHPLGNTQASHNLNLHLFNERERNFSYSFSFTHGLKSTLLPPTRGQMADMNLNAVAVPLGRRLRDGEITRAQMGDLIRQNLCNMWLGR